MANPGTTSHGIIRSDFPGGWDEDKKNAFTGSGLGAAEKEAQDYLRTLLKWRLDKDVIHSGKTTHFRPEDGSYVYFRHNDHESVMVILNKNEDAVSLDLSRFEERLQGYSTAQDVVSGETRTLGESLNLPARSVLVLELN